MRSALLLAWFSITLPACKDEPERSDAVGEIDRIEVVHRYAALPSRILLDSLKFRKEWGTKHFDRTIKFLTAQRCDAKLDADEWIDSKSVDELWDTSALEYAVFPNGCGYLILRDGSSRCPPFEKGTHKCVERRPRDGNPLNPLRTPLPTRILLDCLQLRQTWAIKDFDRTIKFLTSRMCQTKPNVEDWIESSSIDELYDMSVIDRAISVYGCGYLILDDGSSRCPPFERGTGHCVEPSSRSVRR